MKFVKEHEWTNRIMKTKDMKEAAEKFKAEFDSKIPSFAHLTELCSVCHAKVEKAWHNCKPNKTVLSKERISQRSSQEAYDNFEGTVEIHSKGTKICCQNFHYSCTS